GSGEEVALGEASHSFDWELAGLAALSGVQARPLPTTRGRIDPEAVAGTLRTAGGFRPACRLLIVENTHNFHGGAVVPIDHLRTLRELARERGARLHLDGARLWNAAVASRTPLDAYGAVADTIMVCLSKGLGAPVGSMLVGDADLIGRAREVRKLFGGGMRQVGVLAAPGRVAVGAMRERLVEDHARAQRLAEGFLENPGVSLPYGEVETNILMVTAGGHDARRIQDALDARGVRAIAVGAETLRFVTHYDVTDEGVERAIRAFAEALSG
ncbi:MAG: threonine aldolase family protein, partial [Planctomycetota bacterium]